jgi:importin subunit alpha-6/7
MCQDSDLVYTCLEGLKNILKAGEAGKKGQDSGTNTNPYSEFILECRGLDILEDLQDVDNDRIYKLVMELLESYWEEEVSDDPDVPGSTDFANTSGTTPEEAAAAQPPIPSSSADEAN